MQRTHRFETAVVSIGARYRFEFFGRREISAELTAELDVWHASLHRFSSPHLANRSLPPGRRGLRSNSSIPETGNAVANQIILVDANKFAGDQARGPDVDENLAWGATQACRTKMPGCPH